MDGIYRYFKTDLRRATLIKQRCSVSDVELCDGVDALSVPCPAEAICGFIPRAAQPHFLSGTDYGMFEWQKDRAANLQL